FAEIARLGVEASTRVFHSPCAGDQNNLLTVPLVLVAADLAFVLDHFVIDPGKQAGPIIVIVLGPAIRRMIVALGAAQARAQEHLRRRLGPRRRIAVGAIIVGGRTGIGAAARGD